MARRETRRHINTPGNQAHQGAARTRADHIALLGVVGAALVAYLPALQNGFVWDDPIVLRRMRAMVSWRDLVIMPPEVPSYYYRPFILITYFVDRALGGEIPFWCDTVCFYG